MTSSKHTPGPWIVTTIDHSSGGGGDVPSTLFRVGFLSQKDFAVHVADKCHDDSYANSLLIAAAPELLAALKAMQAYAIAEIQRGGAHHDPVWAQVAAAIAKAEGRS